TGLHFDDVHKLLEVLNRLVDLGNTVIVIEHNMEVIKVADWVIDLGPEAGDAGGHVVAEGTPEEVASAPPPESNGSSGARNGKIQLTNARISHTASILDGVITAGPPADR